MAAEFKQSYKDFTNRDVIQMFVDSRRSFAEFLKIFKETYPEDNRFSDVDSKALQTKIQRLNQKLLKLKKNKKASEACTLENQFFEFPQCKHNPEKFGIENDVDKTKLFILTSETKKVVSELRSVKRYVEVVEDENEILSTQISEYERKVSLLLSLLHVTTTKHKEILQTVKDKKQMQQKCEQWEAKYNQLSNQLDNTLEELQIKEDRLKLLCTRNTNKKIKRRDEKIEQQKQQLNEKDEMLEAKEVVINEIKNTCEKKDLEINSLKRDKRNLLVKVCRLAKKAKSEQVEEINEKITVLKEEINSKEAKIIELENLVESLENPIIETFQEGKYVNEVRETIMSLVTEFGVSQRKVNGVMEIVLKNLTGRSLSRLPSAGVRSRLMVEAKRIAQMQVAQAMLEGEGGDMTSYKGNCLHQDGTSKFHRHFQSFQITTPNQVTYSLGLSEVGSGEASSIMESFKQHLKELGTAVSQKDSSKVSELVCSIVSTMSDQGATNPVFNEQLQSLKQTLMPEVIENWDDIADNIRYEMTKISSFFCKMHVFVNMAGEVDKCLSLFEESVCDGKNPFSFSWKESGGARLVRTASKALTMLGCEKSGVGHHFSTYLENKGKKNQLVSFRGHRFNHLFTAAGRTYHHRHDIKDFLQSLSDPNELLKSVAFDITEPSYISSIRALGIIDKLITGPFWRIIESKQNILELNTYLGVLKDKLEMYAHDASPLMAGEPVFNDTTISKDDVFDSLFEDVDEPVLNTYTQMALELAAGGMLLILERQAKDQLEGGKFHHPDVNDQQRAISTPTTNTCSERDFAQLDILMRLKPAASTECLESIIMWTNNKTSSWLTNKSDTEREIIIDKARKDFPTMIDQMKEKRNRLFKQKLEKLHQKQEKKKKSEEKQYNQNVLLTSKLGLIGGLWTTNEQIDKYQQSLSKDQLKEAIVTQIQFRKLVLKSDGPKQLFQQSYKGKQFNTEEMIENLKSIIMINKDKEDTSSTESLLKYKDLDEVSENIKDAKQKLAKRIQDGRQKIVIKQQQTLLKHFVENPQEMVGKKIKHKFRLPQTNETEWFIGTVLKVDILNGRKSKYEVLYDEDDESSHYPLLLDFEKGDLFIVE